MNHVVTTHWAGDMRFEADINGHSVVMDAHPRSGGHDAGPSPKPLLLAAVAGCSGMDVAALLRKAEAKLDALDIEVTGELTLNVVPSTYARLHMVYQAAGPESSQIPLLKAISDSQALYCGVSHMLAKAAKITWELVYNGIPVASSEDEISPMP